MGLMDFTIPVSLRDTDESDAGWPRKRYPISGDCVHCGCDTEDKDHWEWLHDECRDELIAGQRQDARIDNPRHGQARWINGG